MRVIARDFPQHRAGAQVVRRGGGAAVRAAHAGDRPAGLRAARDDPVGRELRHGGGLRADVFAGGGLDRAHARGVDRLDDVRVLHPQQHRRRVPVLRRRSLRRPRHGVLPGLQRRVRRRARRLPHRARPVVAPSIPSWRRTRRSSSRPSCSRAPPACGWAMRCSRRAAAPGAWRSWTRRATRSCCCTASPRCWWWPPPSRPSGRRPAGSIPIAKYSVAAVCWAAVLAYFVFQGRRAG